MQKTIFMVDDNVTNLAKAEEVLENHYLVITLSSAGKMFTVLEKVKPDLILLDIAMPDMDGLEAIKVLKSNAKYANIPVIFLTGLTDTDTEAYAIELGAVDFITKPFSEPVLLNRIKIHLHTAESINKKTEQLEYLQNILIQTITASEEAIEAIQATQANAQAADILHRIKNQLEEARIKLEKEL
jgi:putative two-component system response regulator